MKKLLVLFISSFLLVGVISSSAYADAAKGQKYYLKFFKKQTGMTGAKFATQHTQAEWKDLFASDGAKFKTVYSEKFPSMKEFLNGEKFDKYMEHIKDFCVEYASDSGNVPSC